MQTPTQCFKPPFLHIVSQSWGFVNTMKIMKTSYEGESYKEIMLILFINMLVPKGKFRETLICIWLNAVTTFGQQIVYAIRELLFNFHRYRRNINYDLMIFIQSMLKLKFTPTSLLLMMCNIFKLCSPTFKSKWLHDDFKLTEWQVFRVIEKCRWFNRAIFRIGFLRAKIVRNFCLFQCLYKRKGSVKW
jgi:hypothetical protein